MVRLFFIIYLCTAFALPAAAEIFSYRDSDGRLHAVSSIDDVPEEYRDQVEAFSSDEPEYNEENEDIRPRNEFDDIRDDIDAHRKEIWTQMNQDYEIARQQEKIVVEDYSIIKSDSEVYYEVSGTIKNGSDWTWKSLRVSITFNAWDDTILKYKESYIDPSVLKPGARGFFSILIPFDERIDEDDVDIKVIFR